MSSEKMNMQQGNRLDLITKRVTNRYKRRFVLVVFCVPASIAWFGIVLRGINTGLDIFTIFVIAFVGLLILTLLFWPIYLIAMDNQIHSTVTEILNENITYEPLTHIPSSSIHDAITSDDDYDDTEEGEYNLSDPSQSQMANAAIKSMLYEDQLKG